MKLIITFALLAVSHARLIRPGCSADVVSINNNNYEKEVLKDNVQDPYQMAIDYDTDTLFFSYTARTQDEVFKSASLNLKTNEFNIIPGIIGGFAASVDRNSHKVYLGGRNGIYEYDYATRKAVHTVEAYSVWQMFAKDTLYYTAYPQERVYTVEGQTSVLVPELIRTMVLLVAVDNNKDLYFSNSSGLFYFTQSDKKITQLGEYTINSFTSDIDGNLYFSTPSGIYTIDSNRTVKKLAEADDVLGLVVERDNSLIYGTGDKIVRLKPAPKNCL